MTDVLRMRVAWSGAQIVGPGVSTLYCAASPNSGWGAATVTLFTALRPYLPSGVFWDIPSVVDIIDEASGRLTGQYTVGGGGQVGANGGSSDYKPGTGFRMRWATASVVGGRKVTGTTFICPVLSALIPNGQLDGTTRTAVVAAMAAYLAPTTFTPVVYSPPVQNTPDPKGRNRPGASSEIVSGSVPTAYTWLRSRRT
jgi:hypothetical protein